MKILKRAFRDTISHLKTLLTAIFAGIVSLIALYYWKGDRMAYEEIAFVVVGVIGAACGVLVIFLWNLLAAPYRIEKERADAAEARVAELKSGTELPNTVLQSLSDKQEENEQLKQTLIDLSSIFEQYQRLLNATFLFSEFKGTSLRQEDIGIVASFISEEAKKLLPQLPFKPNQSLIFQTGWNQYRYIFSTPKRIPPKINFLELPNGVSAEILRVSKIDFEVSFFHAPSQNREQVAPQLCTASAEL